MAFESATGHGNLPNGNFSPVIYSQKVLKFFKTTSIVDEITNTDFEGEISDMGDTVRIIKQPEVTVADYRRGTEVEVQDLDDDDTTLVVDQAKYFAFQLDDIESQHQHVSFEDMATDAGNYALKNNYDQNVLNNVLANATAGTSAGTDASPVTVGFGSGNDFTPMDIINRLARDMDEADVPDDGGRWIVASPQFYEQLGREDSKLIQVDVTGDPESIVRNRKLGASRPLHGFVCYKTNNSPISTTNSRQTILAGHISGVAPATTCKHFRPRS